MVYVPWDSMREAPSASSIGPVIESPKPGSVRYRMPSSTTSTLMCVRVLVASWTRPRWRCTSKPSAWHVAAKSRSEEHTSELQSRFELVCRLLLEKKNKDKSEIEK